MVRAMSLLLFLAGSALFLVGLSGTSAAQDEAEQLEYGAYLASECFTCHRLDAHEGGIPPLGHLPKEYFIVAMQEYRTGNRRNPAMVAVAMALGRDEIEALAAYYASLRDAE